LNSGFALMVSSRRILRALQTLSKFWSLPLVQVTDRLSARFRLWNHHSYHRSICKSHLVHQPVLLFAQSLYPFPWPKILWSGAQPLYRGNAFGCNMKMRVEALRQGGWRENYINRRTIADIICSGGEFRCAVCLGSLSRTDNIPFLPGRLFWASAAKNPFLSRFILVTSCNFACWQVISQRPTHTRHWKIYKNSKLGQYSCVRSFAVFCSLT